MSSGSGPAAGGGAGEIGFAVTDGVAEIVLNRPAKHNALTAAMRAELFELVQSAGGDPEVRAVVLRGSGPSFCSGQDVKEPLPAPASTRTAVYERHRANLSLAISECPVPVIAAVQGAVSGRGLEIALAADLRIAGVDARLGFPEVSHGMVVGGGGARRLARMVGESRALSMLLLGEHLDAETARSVGLVVDVRPVDELREAALTMARSLVAVPEMTMYAAKTSVRHAFDVPTDAGAWTDTAVNVLTSRRRPADAEPPSS